MTYRYMHCVKCYSTPKGSHFCHRCDRAKPDRRFYRDRKTGRITSGCIECRRDQSRTYGRVVLGATPRRMP